jgi:signal peptide peptidase SppA
MNPFILATLRRPWALLPEVLALLEADVERYFAAGAKTETYHAVAKQDTKRVDGEDLPKSAFAYRPDDKLENWKLPIEFSTTEKTERHIRDAISRWPKTDMPDAAEKDKARGRIKAAAKTHNIDVSDDSLAMTSGTVEATSAAASRMAGGQPGSVAVIPVRGVISHHGGGWWSDGSSVDGLASAFRSAINDPSVSAVVLDIDSPGGSVGGVPELAAEIYRARGKKPIVALANSLMASAAYWLGSAAGELVCVPSGSVGSVGVYGMHQDVSKMMENAGLKHTLVSYGKYKTEGNPYEPLTDEARAAMQKDIDEYGDMFTHDVARNRKASVADVRSGFGEGRVVNAAQAVKLGMADRIGTLDDVLGSLGAAPAGKRRAQAGGSQCACPCVACSGAEGCHACTNADCNDGDCTGCPQQAGSDNIDPSEPDNDDQAKAAIAFEQERLKLAREIAAAS